MQLVRLIPYCERNYNLIELVPRAQASRTFILNSRLTGF
jgi:predicted ATP-dependent Lon-type protease